MKPLLITEIFHSIQGEGSRVGRRFAFIRLSGCNLRCSYCDTAYAFKGGTLIHPEEILERIRPMNVQDVLLTGGEPLLQKGTVPLLDQLLHQGYDVSIETHGESSIKTVVKKAHIIMDIKTPGSGESEKPHRWGFRKNYRFLKPTDEIKFVITGPEDFAWAKAVLQEPEFPQIPVYFSPANLGPLASTQPSWLADAILAERLPVRFQIQLHKTVWGDVPGK